MIRKSLIMKIFGAFYMQRWNDRMRPMEFIEMDKQAHKMIIAWFFGKFEETRANFDWVKLIEGAFFEFMQRSVITDIKPPVFYRIKSDPEKYRKLNEYVFRQLEPVITPLGEGFCGRFRDWFTRPDDSIERRVLGAAHLYSSRWEYDLIQRVNPDSYDREFIQNDFDTRIQGYRSLEGMKQLTDHLSYTKFINLCGQLRFQSRWAQLHRIPRTSVLGHSLFVALLSWLFTYRIGGSPRRIYNNFFNGLFHDLPEVLTRDIITPVKRSIEGLSDLIKEYEKDQLEQVIFPLIPSSFHEEIGRFTENEFESTVVIGGIRTPASSEEITKQYNEDRFEPRDGQIVKACDELSAFIEATVAIENGCKSEEFEKARSAIRERYGRMTVAGIPLGEIYADL
jgi:putative hydrolase of HD superfamily